MYVRVYLYVCVYMYAYIYTYIHTYKHALTHSSGQLREPSNQKLLFGQSARDLRVCLHSRTDLTFVCAWLSSYSDKNIG